MKHSIESHGFKPVAVSALVLPGDFESRRKAPHIPALAESYLLTGGQPAEPIVVEQRTWRLIAGCDRVAAAMHAGVKHLTAHVVSGPPTALEALTLVENAHRRHNAKEQNEAIARLLEMEQADAPPAKPKPGRPSKGVTEAAKKVAAITGKSTSAVINAARRAKLPEAPEPPACAESLAIDTLGLDIPEDIRKRTAAELVAMTGIHRELAKLQRSLTEFRAGNGKQFQLLQQTLHDAAVAAKSSMPKSVCPWCKLLPDMRPTCIGCGGRGYLTVGEAKACTAEELWATGSDAGVYVGGRFVHLNQGRKP